MRYIAARWADPEQTTILAERDDGATASIPAVEDNADFRLIRDGNPDADVAPLSIVEYAAPSPTTDSVRAEARRRILSAFPEWKQANMTARAVELVDKLVRGETLTDAEADERAAIDAAWGWIKAVRAASNALESDPPSDYAADAHWPE